MTELKEKDITILKKNIFIEYAGLVNRYVEAKTFLKQEQLLDSLSSIHQSLHHWARLAVWEIGEKPETTIWEQLRDIDPSVYRLYEELATSKEPLHKRIELFLLALDFSVLSRMENCVQFLLDILRSRSGSWTVEEIITHPSLADRTLDITLLLDKMVGRSLIKEGSIQAEGSLQKTYRLS